MRVREIFKFPDGKVTYEYILGYLRSAAGGTRVNDENLLGREMTGNDRPWQPGMVIPPYASAAECPFETRVQIELVKETFNGVDLRRFRNNGTPFKNHHLIIPDVYNPHHAALVDLYGLEHLQAALAFASSTIAAGDYKEPVQFNVHVGPTAGQRIQWLHWHLIECMPPMISFGWFWRFLEIFGGFLWKNKKRLALETIKNNLRVGSEDFLVFRQGNLCVFAAGSRSGQLFIVPDAGCSVSTDALGSFLHSFVRMCNGVFESKQGLAPDYSLNLMFSNTGTFELGMYVPILNFQGGTEYWGHALGLPEIMPVTHQKTAALLRKYIAQHGF